MTAIWRKKNNDNSSPSPAIEGIHLTLFFKIISMHLSGIPLPRGEGFVILQRYSYESVWIPGILPEVALMIFAVLI